MTGAGKRTPLNQSRFPHLQQQSPQLAHLLYSRQTNSVGQSVDIYENPSEHYSALLAGRPPPEEEEEEKHLHMLPTLQPATTGEEEMRPHYYMEDGANGPQLRVGYGKGVN